MRFIFLYNKYSTYLFKSLPTTLKILLKKHHFKGRTLCFVTDHHICFPYHVTYVIDDFKIRLCKKTIYATYNHILMDFIMDRKTTL